MEKLSGMRVRRNIAVSREGVVAAGSSGREREGDALY
jgi:hypothetical protein